MKDVAGKRDKYDDSKADRLRIREAAGGGLFVVGTCKF